MVSYDNKAKEKEGELTMEAFKRDAGQHLSKGLERRRNAGSILGEMRANINTTRLVWQGVLLEVESGHCQTQQAKMCQASCVSRLSPQPG